MPTIKIERMEGLWYLINHVSMYEMRLQEEVSKIKTSFSHAVDGSKGESINALMNMMNQMGETVFVQFPEYVSNYKNILSGYYNSIQDLGFVDKVTSMDEEIDAYWRDNVREQIRKTAEEVAAINAKINRAAEILNMPEFYNVISDARVEEFASNVTIVGKDITETHTALATNQQQFIKELQKLRWDFSRLSRDIKSIAEFTDPKTGCNPKVLKSLIEQGHLKIEDVPEYWKLMSRSGDCKAMEYLLAGNYKSFYEIYPDNISDAVYYVLLDKLTGLENINNIKEEVYYARVAHQIEYETAPDVQLPSWYYENYQQYVMQLNNLTPFHKIFGVDPDIIYSDAMPDNEIGREFLKITFGIQMGILGTMDSIVGLVGNATYFVLDIPGVSVSVYNGLNTQGERDNLLGKVGQGLQGAAQMTQEELIDGDSYTRSRFVSRIVSEIVIDYALLRGVGKIADAIDDARDGRTGMLSRKTFMDADIGDIPRQSSVDDIARQVDPEDLAKGTGGVDDVKTIKPNQEHHYATNKNSTYTPQFEEILKQYGFDLDAIWNKELMPHQGRHPNAYHEYILENIKQFHSIAQGDKKVFKELFENLKKHIKANPEMLYKDYWATK